LRPKVAPPLTLFFAGSDDDKLWWKHKKDRRIPLRGFSLFSRVQFVQHWQAEDLFGHVGAIQLPGSPGFELLNAWLPSRTCGTIAYPNPHDRRRSKITFIHELGPWLDPSP